MRRNERARSARKQCSSRDTALPRKQPLGEIIFEGDFDQGISEQVGVFRDAADALCFINEGVGETPS